MTDQESKNNIVAAFASNKEAETFFADANGHCFTEATDNLKKVERKDFKKDIEALEADQTKKEKAAEEVSEEKETKNKTKKD